MNHSTFAEIVTEEEEECLRYLQTLDIADAEDVKSGCKLVFTFLPNRFFENSTIIKEFNVAELEAQVVTSEIKWKIPRPKLEKKGNNQKLSFFAWLEGGHNENDLLDIIREDIWPNPVYYFTVSFLHCFRRLVENDGSTT